MFPGESGAVAWRLEVNRADTRPLEARMTSRVGDSGRGHLLHWKSGPPALRYGVPDGL